MSGGEAELAKLLDVDISSMHDSGFHSGSTL
jgi:hypothetical protein